MVDLTETAVWRAGVYQLETTDPVLGGPGGVANRAAGQLADRTLFLKGEIDALKSGTAGLGTAAQRDIGADADAKVLDRGLGDARWASKSVSATVTALQSTIASLGDAAQRDIGADADVKVLDRGLGDARWAAKAHEGAGGAAHAEATTAAAGFMSAADKLRLDNLLTARWQSPEIEIVTAGLVELAHGLGAEPWRLDYRLICKQAEGGYAIGDIVDPIMSFDSVWSGNAVWYQGASVRADATHVRIRFGATSPVFIILRASDGGPLVITHSKWRFIVRAHP